MAAAGCALAALAVSTERFALLCVGILLIGANLAFVQQYRFVAAEAAPPGREARAVSVGLNDFLVFGGEALAALGAGALLHRTGWAGVNLVALLILTSMAVVLFMHRSHRRRTTAAVAPVVDLTR